jgi:hypothetical protein
MRRMNKKAFVFTLDMMIAIIVLIIGIVIMFYKFTSGLKTIYFTEQLSEDMIGVLSYTNIKDLCINPGESSGCDCPNYRNLTQIVCSGNLRDMDANLLSMTSEVLERGLVDGNVTKNMIHEIFVTKQVIDERRFGFAILYLTRSATIPLELYNTECYNDPAMC